MRIFALPSLVLTLLLLAAVPAAAQDVGGQELPRGVTAQEGVTYGKARPLAGGAPARLRLDLYRGARTPRRGAPVMIWIHGGAFLFGERAHMARYAADSARRGFVSATISYRLASSVQFIGQAIPAAQHDAQASVRWFRRHARRLGVDPKRIFIGGYSAGAVTALNVAYAPRDPGDSGNAGYSSKVSGAVSIAGLTSQKIGRRAPDVLLFHGRNDTTVPYSASVKVCAEARALKRGCKLVSYDGVGHEVGASRFGDIVRRTAAWLRPRL
jgi:acetyl esterase/lipase